MKKPVEHPYNGINTPDGEAIHGRSAEGLSYSWKAGGGEEGRKRWSLLFLQEIEEIVGIGTI
jgi:hypothetical protein